MAKRLMNYLNERRLLNAPNLVAFVTSRSRLHSYLYVLGTKGGAGSDGMTPEEQRSTLAKFHSGEIKVSACAS